MLPDDALLAIFDFYVVRIPPKETDIEAWVSLVHVCRRWRCVVFGSPRRLNLRLVCAPGTPARETLDVWPALPLVIEGTISSTSADNIVVAPGYMDRVCRIDLRINGRLQCYKVLAAMQAPFPALTHLLLRCHDNPPAVIPDTFLGGSAPRLEYLRVECIPFPGIPKILSSATHLVDLCLIYIPPSGYISPEAMVTCLSVLTSLDTFTLSFLSSQSRPESRRPPPMTRSLLPDLTRLYFEGAGEYLDDLVARIDAPRLGDLSMNFLQRGNFDTPHIVQFISRTPRFREPSEARVELDFESAVVGLILPSGDWLVEIICHHTSDQYLSSVAQVCALCLPPFPTLENLRFEVFSEDLFFEWDRKDEVENNQWLGLLRPFTAVKNLYLSKEVQPNMASALRELVGGRTTEVLPSLQNIFLARSEASGPFQEAIRQFVAARQLSGHPIAISVGG